MAAGRRGLIILHCCLSYRLFTSACGRKHTHWTDPYTFFNFIAGNEADQTWAQPFVACKACAKSKKAQLWLLAETET